MEKELLESVKKEVHQKLETIVDERTKKAVGEEIAKALEKNGFISEEEAKKTSEELVNKSKGEMQKYFETQLNEVSAKLKKLIQTEKKTEENTVKSFNENMLEALKEREEDIRNFNQGDTIKIVMKDAGDMSIEANFTNSTPYTQDVRHGLIETPYNRVWLPDILPSGTSDGISILFPKESGGEGGVDVWTDKEKDKPQMDFDFSTQVSYFKWLAGIVIVDRDMLDNIPWMFAYLQRKMLIAFKTAENNFILNGATTGANPVQGLNALSKAYNGDYTNPVDQIIDAAWGQIPEATHDFYNPTNVIINPRTGVKLGLNKAGGSGEYDLPSGSVSFANGRTTIGGLSTVTTTAMEKDKYMVFDRNALTYFTRMSPEITMHQGAELAKKNKIMFRIEGKNTLTCFNDDALVKGELNFAAADSGDDGDGVEG